MRIARVAAAALLACGLVATLAAAQPRPPLVGFFPLGSATSEYDRSLVEAFRQGVREAGLAEGRDLVLEVVWTTDETQVASAVATMVHRGAKLLVPVGTTASMAVKRQAPTTPILFISVGNPLGIGLVESLAHPGGNVTGFSDNLAEISAKYVQFAAELGSPTVVHYLWHSGFTDGHFRLLVTEQAAQSLKIQLRARAFTDVAEADEALAAMKKAGASVVIVQPSPFTFRMREPLIEAATRHRLATIFAFRPAAAAGSMITYGPDYADLYRRAASYLARILRGTKPSNLPVEQPTKFELLINLKTAKTIGITLPRSLVLRADQVIE